MTAPRRCLIRYDREGSFLRLTLNGTTNHEIREVICGLWARLDADDRHDHIAMLQHYERVLLGTEPGHLSAPAQAIKDGLEGSIGIHLSNIPIPGDEEQ